MVFHKKTKTHKKIECCHQRRKNRSSRIIQLPTCRYITITINETLSWAQHVAIVRNKTSKVIGTIYQLKNTFPVETKKNLYKSLIASYLNYGLLLWGTISHKVLTL